jgi:hypothetical protein
VSGGVAHPTGCVTDLCITRNNTLQHLCNTLQPLSPADAGPPRARRARQRHRAAAWSGRGGGSGRPVGAAGCGRRCCCGQHRRSCGCQQRVSAAADAAAAVPPSVPLGGRAAAAPGQHAPGGGHASTPCVLTLPTSGGDRWGCAQLLLLCDVRQHSECVCSALLSTVCHCPPLHTTAHHTAATTATACHAATRTRASRALVPPLPPPRLPLQPTPPPLPATLLLLHQGFPGAGAAGAHPSMMMTLDFNPMNEPSWAGGAVMGMPQPPAGACGEACMRPPIGII